MNEYRREQDFIGEKWVPKEAYYGVQSLRGRENFPLTGRGVHPQLLRGMLEIKLSAALANKRAGALSPEIADAIVSAAREILAGGYERAFVTDALQGGAGTSMNMNVNEVLANRAEELLGGQKGQYLLVHPNDHVNCGQSTNDVVPSAGRIAVIHLLNEAAVALESLGKSFREKASVYRGVIKMGRTELQDAVPIGCDQVFSAYATAMERSGRRCRQAAKSLLEINLGATAVGTSINAHPYYLCSVVPILSEVTGLDLRQAQDLVDATQHLDELVYVSGAVKAAAVALSKIAHDLRLLSSGPRTGLGELYLEPRQNGSSIMPGKVNPVIPEAMNQVAYVVMGADITVTMAAEAGQLELNAFEPVLLDSLLSSIDLLQNGARMLEEQCVVSLEVNEARCRENVENSIGIVTALCPRIGYQRAAALAKRALQENKSVREILREEAILPPEEWEALLDFASMV